VLSACAPASGTFQADKCDAFGLTVQLYWLRNISGTAAVRAVVRSHSLPLRIEGIVDYLAARFAIDSFPLRITNKNSESSRHNWHRYQARATTEVNFSSEHRPEWPNAAVC
jgi:hypothetical protein